jgi:hypothetical protein
MEGADPKQIPLIKIAITIKTKISSPHPFWRVLMKVKDDFFRRGSFTLGDGLITRYLEDTWLMVLH